MSETETALERYRREVTAAHARYQDTMTAARLYLEKRVAAAHHECAESVARAVATLMNTETDR